MQYNVTACQRAQCLASIYKYKSGKTHKSSSHVRTTASTTAAWAHLRALRDTGNTCHGTPDLGEGPSGAHACTTCPWNAKRKRQEYGCRCMCGDMQRVSHIQRSQTGHQTDTQDTCRAVNQWPTGKWHVVGSCEAMSNLSL